jgi:hypothetical protein
MFSQSEVLPLLVAVTAQDQILLAGPLIGHDEDGGPGTFLAVATPAGIDRIHRITGPATQSSVDLAAARDGHAWLLTTSYGGEDEPDPVLRFAGHELAGSGSYLLEIVP